MILYIKNYISTVSCIIFAYFLYYQFPYFHSFFAGNYGLYYLPNWTIDFITIFQGLIIGYIILLLPFYYFHTQESKALIMIGFIKKFLLGKKYIWSQEEKVAILTWGIKIFFAPLMIFWAISGIFDIFNGIYIMQNSTYTTFLNFFNTHFFWLCFRIILAVDVLIFMSGYLIESKYLHNTIKSVEPSILGWGVTLACYPPLNTLTGQYLGWYSTDFPQFTDTYVHIFLNICILLCFAIYSWASISLGWKASNLTNRGIIEHGPYRFVRHPAYIAKTIAWTIGTFPMILMAGKTNNTQTLGLIIFSIIGWGVLYYLRAWTEERHLSQDSEYRKYKKQVPYMFLPKII